MRGSNTVNRFKLRRKQSPLADSSPFLILLIMVDAEPSKLSRAAPLALPTDLTPPALFLSPHNLTPGHIGRKLRLVVQ